MTVNMNVSENGGWNMTGKELKAFAIRIANSDIIERGVHGTWVELRLDEMRAVNVMTPKDALVNANE